MVTSSLTAATGVARGPWYNPALAEMTHRSWLRPTLVGAALLLGVAADAGVLEPSIEHVLRTSQDTSWLLAVTLTLVATAAAATAGWHLRGATGNHPGERGALIGPLAILAGWLLFGAVITAVRLTAAQIAQGAAFDGATSTAAPKETIPALAFLLLYLLTGVVAAVECYTERNDAFTAVLAARRRAAALAPQLRDAQALHVRLIENYHVRQQDIAALAGEHATELAGNAALARELMELSRVEQAVGLASPITTGPTSASHPLHPLFQNPPFLSVPASRMAPETSPTDR